MNTEQTDHTQTPEDRKVRLEFRVAEYVEDRTRNKEFPQPPRYLLYQLMVPRDFDLKE